MNSILKKNRIFPTFAMELMRFMKGDTHGGPFLFANNGIKHPRSED